MHLSEQQELAIQRCVDDELTPAETRELLAELDTMSDGWKSLACGLLEDRVLRSTLHDALSDVADPDVSAATSGSASSTASPADAGTEGTTVRRAGQVEFRNRWHTGWFSHPLTSMTLCAAIAFVSGLLIPKPADSLSARRSVAAPTAPAASGGSSGTALPRTITAQHDASADDSGIHVQWYPDGSGRQVDVPVYRKPDEWAQDIGGQWQLFQQSGSGSSSLGRQAAMRMIRIPVNDSEDLLLFVREQDLGLPLQ